MADQPEDLRRRMYQLAGTGVEFFSALLVGFVGGYFLDRWLGTRPWLMVVGVAVGFVAGFVRLVILGRGK